MILEQLQVIKKFGCSKESDVTIEDIQKKEQELGVYLPIALKEFYLTFHKDDPIFSSAEYLFSLDELKVKEKSSVGRILIFEDGKRSKIVPTNTEFAFIIGDKNEDEPQLLNSVMDSDTVYYFENTKFSSWLLNQIGYQQLYASPNIIIVQEELSIPKGSELAKQKKYSVIHKLICSPSSRQ